MSPSSRRWIRNSFGFIAALAVIGSGTWAVRLFLDSDPFQDYRPGQNQAGEKPAVTMSQTALKGYQEGKLVMSAETDRIEVSADRNVYTALKLRKGVFKEGDKTTWEFQSDRGVWQDQVKSLGLTGNIRAWNKDIDLKLVELQYSNQTQDLHVPAKVQGKFFDGNIKGENLKLNFKKDKWSVQNVVWVGILPVQDGAPLQPARNEPWTLTGASAVNEGGRQTWFKATAKNSETEIRADKILTFKEDGTGREILVATGNVRYFGVDANLLCDQVTVFRKERRAILEGRVNMLIKPEDSRGLKPEELQPMRPIVPEDIATGRVGPPPANASASEVRNFNNRRKYPVKVVANRIEYWYGRGSRRAVVTGNPQARQDLPNGMWRMVWAPRAEWDGENERLKLLGAAGKQDVRSTLSDGSRVKAETFTVSTAREAEDNWSATLVEAIGTVDDEDLPSTSPSTSPPGVSGPIG